MVLQLSTLLSQALVAFTIEADHTFEQRMPHCTTESRKRGEPIAGPWLISMPFWANCLKHVAPEGMTVGELFDEQLVAGHFLLGSNPGLVRWGYLRLTPGSPPSKKVDRTWAVAPTPPGLLAQRTWARLPTEVADRWTQRWPEVAALRALLEKIVADADRELPDYLPVNGGHEGRVRLPIRPPRPTGELDVGTLLAKALLLFTIDVEATSPVALVHSANVLRALAEGPVLQRNLPQATGVAKETLAVMTGRLRRDGLLSVSAAKEVELTRAGRTAAVDASDAVAAVERNWPTEIRTCLEPLVGDGTVAGSALAEAIRPPEGTWRHRRPQPLTPSGRVAPRRLPRRQLTAHRTRRVEHQQLGGAGGLAWSSPMELTFSVPHSRRRYRVAGEPFEKVTRTAVWPSTSVADTIVALVAAGGPRASAIHDAHCAGSLPFATPPLKA